MKSRRRRATSSKSPSSRWKTSRETRLSRDKPAPCRLARARRRARKRQRRARHYQRQVKAGLTVMVNGIRALPSGSARRLHRPPVKDTAVRKQADGFPGHQARPQAQQRGRVATRILEANQAKSARSFARPCRSAVVKGIVKNITDYGAFVDLGGIDGLLHITDLAWRRVSILPKSSPSATRCRRRCSSSTRKRTASRSA